MFDPFSHFISYGATDQSTLRELATSYDGLLVPGTVAAFQREGTGGFVLSLSATEAETKYVIDPRFPLFQQRSRSPKKSHERLAEVFGDLGLIASIDPSPTDFSSSRVGHLADSWLAFNSGYRVGTMQKFEKYARRLNKTIAPSSAHEPQYILSPYFVCEGPDDPWWQASSSFHQRTASRSDRAIRVLATETTDGLRRSLNATAGSRVVVWVSGLQELLWDPGRLEAYARVIRDATAAGSEIFALYGGFFHVLLRSVGLKGASHGVGYGEYRVWRELPQSGPPPARYYMRAMHRYVSQDLAGALHARESRLFRCSCPVCRGRSPLSLDYHELMKHSVHARTEEINAWASVTAATACDLLDTEFAEVDTLIPRLGLPLPLRNQARKATEHLPRWSVALRGAIS